jgi:hypothetical protein
MGFLETSESTIRGSNGNNGRFLGVECMHNQGGYFLSKKKKQGGYF